MPTPTPGFSYFTGVGIVQDVATVPTLFDGGDYDDGDIVIKNGIVIAFDPSGLGGGGGGTTDHSSLGNLEWESSGHNWIPGDPYLAGFVTSGDPVAFAIGSGFSLDTMTNTLSVAGVTDHASLTSNLNWTTSGHTSTADRIAFFGASGAATVSANLTFNGSVLAASNSSLGSIELPAHPASRALVINASKLVTESLVTAAELEHLSGATSSIQTQLNNKQPLDSTLTALAAYNTNGIVCQTAADTFVGRTLTGAAAGVTVTNGDGVAGNPTLALTNDLAALEGIAVTGLAARTASDTWAARTLTGPAAGLTITNGDGVAGNPAFAFANDLAAVEGLASNGIAARAATDTWAVRTITGTTSRIMITNGDGVAGNPTVDIAATYVGQTSITTLGTIATGTWNATAIGATKGGTGQTTYTLGDTLYSSAANTLAKLPGNTLAAKRFWTQTGTGTASAAPAWGTVLNSDLVGSIRVGGRLTLQSATPWSTSNQTAKTLVYWTPYNGNTVPIYDSTVANFINRSSAEISVAVPATLFRLFDVYVSWSGSAMVLETVNWDQTTATISAFTAGTQTFTTSGVHGLSVGDYVGIANITGTVGTDATSGVNGRVWKVATVPLTTTFTLEGSNLGALAYTSGGTVYRIPNTRTTSLTATSGIMTKTGDNTRTYLGTGMTTGVSGQCEMSFGSTEAKLLLWNYYNQMPTSAKAYEGSSHSYTTAAWRFWNAKPANRIQFVNGQVQAALSIFNGDGQAGAGYATLGQDSVTGDVAAVKNGNASQVAGGALSAWALATSGCHMLNAVEYGAAGWTMSYASLQLMINM